MWFLEYGTTYVVFHFFSDKKKKRETHGWDISSLACWGNLREGPKQVYKQAISGFDIGSCTLFGGVSSVFTVRKP